MKTSDLTVYDWFFIEGEAQQVMPSLIDYVFYGQPVNIAPIPIDEGILEANGFEMISVYSNSKRYKLWKGEDEIVWAEKDGTYFLVYISNHNGTWDDIVIENVHELQHLLRAAGFDDLANDFKIQ